MTFREDHCKGCNKRMLWLKTAQGNWMPVDPDLVTIIADTDRRVYRGRVPHHATCPEAEQFRRKKRA